MIIVSECSEGFGSDEYREANASLVELGSDAWLESILPKKREISSVSTTLCFDLAQTSATIIPPSFF